MIEQPLGENQLQHRVAVKLQSLIVEMMPLRFIADRRMCERLREQQRVAEFVRLKFREIDSIKLSNYLEV